MKKVIALVSLLAVGVAAIGLLSGCEDSLDFTVSTTTTTTTSTASTSTTATSSTSTTQAAGAKAGDAAQEAVDAVLGVSQTSQSTGNMAGVQPSGFSVSSINAFAGDPTPPTAFFNPLPSDGWITIEGGAFVTGETVQIRMYTAGGDLIDGSFISTKKIASLEGFDWQTMVSTFEFTTFAAAANSWINYPTDWDPTDAGKIAGFYASTSKYRPVSSLWDYIVWAYISQNMGNAIAGAYQSTNMGQTLEAYPGTGTPEATANDSFGTQEAHVTGTYADGSTSDLTMSVSTDAEGKPVSSSGSGTMVRADGTPMTVNSMTMTFSGGAPANGTMDITVGAPDNMHIVMTMTATGAATGIVYDTTTTPEPQIGTIVIYATPDSGGNNGYFEETATGTRYYF